MAKRNTLPANEPDAAELLPQIRIQVEENCYPFDACRTANYLEEEPHKGDVLAAIIKSRANLADMAALLNRSRWDLRRWCSGHADVMEFFREVEEGLVDLAEKMAWMKVEEGDGPMIRFVLERKGRMRGWAATEAVMGASEADASAQRVVDRRNIGELLGLSDVIEGEVVGVG